MSSGANASKALGRREIRQLIEQARLEGRSFEDLFLEMYPDEDSLADEDDCRPFDGISIRSFSNNMSTDYPTRSTAALEPIRAPRLGSVSDWSVVTHEDNTYIQNLKAQADRCYGRHLLREVVEIWRDETQKNLQHTELADLRYDEKVARKCLGKMKEEFYESDDLERKRRLKMFLAWKDRKLAIWAIHAWIIRHRENVVRKRCDDGQNLRAASMILNKWRTKMMHIQQQKSTFRQFFFACKFGRRWMDVVSDRRISRTMATLERKYHTFRREKELRLLQRCVSGWHGKAASATTMEFSAIQQFDEMEERRTRNLGHKAITTMYLSTAEAANMEAAADEKYDGGLKKRVLASDGEWRVKTRLGLGEEQRADLFHAIKEQGKAQLTFRVMRRTAARSKQLDDEADAHRTRVDNSHARYALRRWRAEAAAKRGEIVAQEPPATPAARLTALRLTQRG